MENEDEKIRKEIINYFRCQSRDEPSRKDIHSKWIAWLEKQDETDSSIKWHDVSEEPEKNRELLCEWVGSNNCIWHDTVFYNPDNEAFWNYGRRVDYVTRWCYIDELEKQDKPQNKGEISDGYHTFNELYYYRTLYNAAFFNMLPKEWVHKSKRHNDGEECFGGGWFIVMANLPTGQISNHYELKDWDLFQIPEKEVADKWDGHTPQEAADRLHKYLLEKQDGQKETLCDKCRKEQREALEKAMLDAGYEWDAESKEVKKVEQTHVWSDTDLIDLGYLAYFVNQNGDKFYGKNKPNVVKWIYSFPNRTIPQQEWSEKDEVGFDDATWAIEQARTIAKDENDMGNLWYAEHWLKSLKDRYTWKPSEEQIKALEHFVRSVGESSYASPYDTNTKLVYSLLQDLKKLKENTL